MQKIAILVGALLTFGCITQAHAGEYVFQSGSWISADAPESTATGTAEDWDSQSTPDNLVQTRLRWRWATNDPAQDLPTPVRIELFFSATTGTCSAMAFDDFTHSDTYVGGGFVGGAAPAQYFEERTGAMFEDTDPGFTSTPGLFKYRAGTIDLFEDVELQCYTEAAAFGGDPVWRSGTATAGATSGSLTAFGL